MANKHRPMTLCEKLLANAAIDLQTPGVVEVGQIIRVKVDWVVASELSWSGMEETFNSIDRPSLVRPERFWLAADHVVDPRVNHLPKIRKLIENAERIVKEAKTIDYHAPNQTILHTEFYWERAQPGQIVVGSDSHTCSSGGLGAFAVGLGAADVVMPLVTGETWFKVPETCRIEFAGEPPFGIGGKDTILYVLGELKRNTVASERAVEFTGPGLRYLSCDARFAMSNMTTEFGGLAGVCVPDHHTYSYVNKRRDSKHKSDSHYFHPDPDAVYASSHTIDLSKVPHLVAIYPSPDNTRPAIEVEAEGMALDGVFIGACTTAEEDLILGALVLEAGLKAGMVPKEGRKRKVTPGSVQIIEKLRRTGLLDVYQQAGFDIGAPGCSYCVGMSADRAGEGEVWLSSQNRNFVNRMGKGTFGATRMSHFISSIGNLASAATVAASSFEMRVWDPGFLSSQVDRRRYDLLRGIAQETLEILPEITYEEPGAAVYNQNKNTIDGHTKGAQDLVREAIEVKSEGDAKLPSQLTGKVQRFGSNVDTDAIIPADFLTSPGDPDEAIAAHAFEYVRPEFRAKVKEGYNIVVADEGFGSGSSREEAVRVLTGLGVKACIAKSYAYIFGRNCPNLGLLAIVITDPNFYALVDVTPESSPAKIHINVSRRVLSIEGSDVQFPFDLSDMEQALLEGGGVVRLFKEHGSMLFSEAQRRIGTKSRLGRAHARPVPVDW